VKSIGPYNIHTPYWRCFYNVFYTYDELYYEDFTSATWEFCYPCWTFTVKLHNFGCSYCVATGCSQDRKEAQQQQQEYWYALEYKAPLISTSTNFLQPSHVKYILLPLLPVLSSVGVSYKFQYKMLMDWIKMGGTRPAAKKYPWQFSDFVSIPWQQFQQTNSQTFPLRIFALTQEEPQVNTKAAGAGDSHHTQAMHSSQPNRPRHIDSWTSLLLPIHDQ